MKNQSLLSRIRAAQNLSNAFASGRTPKSADLYALGLPEDFKSNFKR